MTQDEQTRVARAFVGELIAQARKLAEEGMPAEEAVDLVLRQARLAVAVARIGS